MEGTLPAFQARLNLCSTLRVGKSSQISIVRYYLLKFTFIMNSMTQLGFKNEWCPFSRNLFARSSAKRVSTKLGSTSTQQTSFSGIIATGLTTLVMTRNLGSAMAILISVFGINWKTNIFP